MPKYSGKTREEILSQIKGEKAKGDSHLSRHVTVAQVHKFWRQMCAYHYDDMIPVPVMNMKQQGLLKHIVIKCDETGSDVAKRVLQAVLDDWQGFGWYVQAQTSHGAPARPDVGFLSAYINTAIRWTQPNDQKSPQGGAPVYKLSVPAEPEKKSEQAPAAEHTQALPDETVNMTTFQLIAYLKAKKNKK